MRTGSPLRGRACLCTSVGQNPKKNGRVPPSPQAAVKPLHPPHPPAGESSAPPTSPRAVTRMPALKGQPSDFRPSGLTHDRVCKDTRWCHSCGARARRPGLQPSSSSGLGHATEPVCALGSPGGDKEQGAAPCTGVALGLEEESGPWGGAWPPLAQTQAPHASPCPHPHLHPLLLQMNVGGGRPQTHTSKPRGSSFALTTVPLPVLPPCRRPHASPPGSGGLLTAWNRHLEAEEWGAGKKSDNAGMAGKVRLRRACPPAQLEGPGSPGARWLLAGPGAAAPRTTSADTESTSPWGGGGGTVHRRGLQPVARCSAVCTAPLRGTRCSILC